MATLDRFVRQTRRFLEPSEGLLATALGREAGGRRRVAVVATDRRVLLVHLRPEAPRELPYTGLEVTCSRDEGGGRLVLSGPAGRVEVERIADTAAAELLVSLVRRRLDRAAS